MSILARQRMIVLVIWALLAASGLLSLFLSRWSLCFVSFATLALSMVPTILASRFSVTLPLPFILSTTAFIFGSIFMGEAFDFYERFWWWDIALHGFSAVGFGLIGFLFIFMLFEGDRYAAPPSAMAFLAFCLAMTVGGLWEIFEFTMDQALGLNMQKSGLNDTMGDMIVDAFGASIGALSGYLYLIGRKSGLFVSVIKQFVDANRRFYQRSRDRIRK